MLLPVVFAAAAVGGPGMAQGLPCPAQLTWREAIHAQRTAVDDRSGRRVHAETEEFSNAWLAVIDEGGDRAALLRMKAGAHAVALTFGAGRPAPAGFAEMVMAVEAPMGDGSWPRMKRPCDIRDGGVVAFSEKDLPGDRGPEALGSLRFHGVLTRQGLSFSYRAAFEADGANPRVTLHGSLRYGHPAKPFDLATDMQGWHVYRDDRFVRTIPAGARTPLSAVLQELGTREPAPGPAAGERRN